MILLDATQVRAALVRNLNGCKMAARQHGTDSAEYQEAFRQYDEARSAWKRLRINLMGKVEAK